MKFLSLFSGIGAFEKALKNLGVVFDLAAFCELDKYAERSYCAIHNVDAAKNLGDITKVDETKLPKNIDLLSYGFPCQDISVSGHQKGLFNEDGSKTRSGLFFDALRIIEAVQPKIAIAENVKNLMSKKFNAQFQIVLSSLEAAGHNCYWAVLNAKDFGVPQNRERVFIVSIRKDIDTGRFEFPKPFLLEKRLKDILEESVDEKYYLKEIATYPQAGRIYDTDGISPTIDTCSGGNRMPKVAVAMRGRYDDNGQVAQHLEVSDREFANAITTVQKDSLVADGKRIRKLTPRECFRLMGFDDEDFAKAEAVNSNSQLYKQAGNSIVVDVLEHLFVQLIMGGFLDA